MRRHFSLARSTPNKTAQHNIISEGRKQGRQGNENRSFPSEAFSPIKEGGYPKMGCLCNFFEDNKCLWIIIIALILLSCNGCGCGNGCGCD